MVSRNYVLLPDAEEISGPVEVTRTAEVSAFRDYLLAVMETCRAPLSEAARSVRATNLSDIITTRIKERSNQEMFALVLCIENKFKAVGKSSVGATGIAQIMPKYAQEFADLCGIGKLGEGDLDDPSINATLGACLFQSLVERLGSPVLAVAAYNAGASSSSVKNLKALGAPVPETAAYISKMAYLQETLGGLNAK